MKWRWRRLVCRVVGHDWLITRKPPEVRGKQLVETWDHLCLRCFAVKATLASVVMKRNTVGERAKPNT